MRVCVCVACVVCACGVFLCVYGVCVCGVFVVCVFVSVCVRYIEALTMGRPDPSWALASRKICNGTRS